VSRTAVRPSDGLHCDGRAINYSWCVETKTICALIAGWVSLAFPRLSTLFPSPCFPCFPRLSPLFTFLLPLCLRSISNVREASKQITQRGSAKARFDFQTQQIIEQTAGGKARKNPEN